MSILKRFTYSYLFNIVSLIFTFLSGIYLAKSFGPNTYGVFAYVTAVFGGVFYMFDLGSSNAFFTFSSKENKNISFYKNYGMFLFSLLLVILLFFFFIPDSIFRYFQLEFEKIMLLIIIPAIFLRSHVWNVIKKVYESKRLSITINAMNMLVNAAYYLLIIFFDRMFELSLELVFKIILIEYAIFIIITFALSPIGFDNNKKSNSSFKDYYKYCLPIAPVLFFSGFVKVLEPWLINFFGNSEQQAYYSISLQFTMILVLALSSIINIFWKEIAESIKENRFDRVGLMYLSTARYLLLFMTVGSFFLFFQTSNIINLFLGLEYLNATVPMQILFLYPCLQVFGQLNNVMFLANEKTKKYSKYGFLQSFLSILTSIIGLHLLTNFSSSLLSVASFMAFKIVFIDFLFMLITTKEVSRMFNIKSGFNFIYLIPVTICIYAYIVFKVTQLFIPLDMFVANLLLNAFLYLILIIYIIFNYPRTLFISKEDSLFLLKKLKLLNTNNK